MNIGPIPLLLIVIFLLLAGLLAGSMIATWLIPLVFGKAPAAS